MVQLSPLRRRKIDNMTVRNLSPATQRSYLNAVSKLSRILADRSIIWAWRMFMRSRFIWWRRAYHGLHSLRSS